ncbi:MAG: PIN domain-containing protein, partial [Chloroflexota bacterium]
MERLTYLLDTNAVADYLNQIPTTTARIHSAIADGSHIYLAQPVHYEVLRGLLKVGATRKLTVFEQAFAPQLDWILLTDADWRFAAHLWADATRKGKQLSDVDYLIAALAVRLNAVIISDDNDFDS